MKQTVLLIVKSGNLSKTKNETSMPIITISIQTFTESPKECRVRKKKRCKMHKFVKERTLTLVPDEELDT